jgi:hypothetical protein
MPRAYQIPRMRTGFSPTPSTNNELGVKHLDMPLTPCRVWAVIHEAKGL